jgi:DNA-binding transcriptional LysR family regulator
VEAEQLPHLEIFARAIELGSNEAIKEAVLRGLGAAVLSTQAVQREVEEGRLHTVTVADLPLLEPCRGS